MEKEKIKRSYPGCLIALVILAACVWAFFHFNKVEDDNMSRLKRNIEIANQDIKHYKNRVEELTAEVESKRYTPEEFKKIEKDLAKRIEDIAGDVRAVKQYVKFKTEVKDTVYIVNESKIYIVDSTGSQIDKFPFRHSDKYMAINGAVFPDTTIIDYTYKPVYEVLASWKKPEGSGLFAKNRLLVNVVAENPKEVVKEVSAVEVEVPAKSFFNSKAFWSGLAFILGQLTKLIIK